MKNLDKPYVSHLPLTDIDIEGDIESILKSRRTKAILQVKEFKNDSLAIPADGKILVYFPRSFSGSLKVGQTLRLLNATLESLPEVRNPGQFNYADYLKLREIIAQVRLTDAAQMENSEKVSKFSLENNIFSPFRENLVEKIESNFNQSQASFLKALLLGERESLDKDLIENFQNAGVMHVLAISGLHVGFVALIFYIILSFLPIYFKYRNLLIILLLVFYMLLTGSNPPVVRATIMASIILVGLNLEQRTSIYNSIYASAFIILLFQPNQLFWVGFQFSFIAVLSIVYFYKKLEPLKEWLMGGLKNERIKLRISNWILMPLLVSFSAQIGTLPLTMHYFHKLSLVSFFLNIIVIPFIGLIVAMGFIFLFVNFLSFSFASVFADFFSQLIALLTNSVEVAANLPGAFFYIPKFNLFGIFLYGAIILFIFNIINIRFRIISGLFIIILLAIPFIMFSAKSSKLNLVIMDVDQGDGALIITPQKKVILIDTGPANSYFSSGSSVIRPVLNYFGVKNIDKLFISHTHLDHMGGTFELLAYNTIDSVFLPKLQIPYKWSDSLKFVFERNSNSYRELEFGDIIKIDEETRVYVYGPQPQFTNFSRADGRNLNNNSLVLLIKYRDKNLLFPGDAEREVEKVLLPLGRILDADFLKVGHHGSITSSTLDYLNLVTPTYSSISVGQYNRFGHPSSIIIERLRKTGSKIYRTDMDKAVWFQLDADTWQMVDWQNDNLLPPL
jgi:competence protein ComEC